MKAGYNQTETADLLDVYKSTVSRELRRNSGLRGYRPKQAQQLATHRQQDKVRSRIPTSIWINGIGVRGFRYLDKKNNIETQSKVLSDTPVLSTHPHQITLEILVETGSVGCD